MRPYTAAIIAAAGRGTRMTSTPDKLFADLCGRTVISRVLEAFEGAETVDGIIIVTSESNLQRLSLLVSRERFKKVIRVVPGGASRAGSVKKGIEALPPQCEFISIHDGARPFITSAEIDRLHRIAYDKGAVCCGAPVTDTVKVISGSRIGKTLDRASLFGAQTPQIFKKDIYLDALKKAGDDLDLFTDDSSLTEAAGYEVHGEYTALCNMKITTEADLIMGRAVMEERQKAEGTSK